ncbi:MAG: hypothetical protein ACJAYU_002915 [Bradymonadia bacterium]|jgi:hypothetical protein
MDANEDITNDEFKPRVICALLRRAVPSSSSLGVPLADAAGLAESAYFQELRSLGLTIDEAGERMGVSLRKAARLSKKLRDRFIVPEIRHNLPRRIEFMVAVQPMSSARLCQVLSELDSAEVEAALATLTDEGRVRLERGRTPPYHAVKAQSQLPRDTWVRRIGGLNIFAENLAEATFGCFFSAHPGAFARTLTFRLPRGAYHLLEDLYSEHIWPVLSSISEEGDASDDSEPMQVSICWAPYELVHTPEEGNQ